MCNVCVITSSFDGIEMICVMSGL